MTCRIGRRGGGGSACTRGPSRSRRAGSGVRWWAPVVGLVFLGITGGLLITDLKHPMRFYLIFTRPHWRSWLVRGAFIVSGYGAVLAAYLVVGPGGVGGAGGVGVR